MKMYIAGPMSSHPEDFNFPAFFAAEDKLKGMGHEVFNPAQRDIDEWGSMENIKKFANYRDCMRKDLNCILDWAEGLYMLKGWEISTGGRIEHALAVSLKLPIFYEDALDENTRRDAGAT